MQDKKHRHQIIHADQHSWCALICCPPYLLHYTRQFCCLLCAGPLQLGGPKIALRGGWHGRLAKEGGGGGAPEMGFRAGPFVLCKDGCATKGAGTQILARKIFFTKNSSPTYV